MQESNAGKDTSSRTILIVEDNESVRKVAAKMLIKLGYEPFGAETGTEAIEMFEQAEKPVDLALVDMTMPDMDGLEICQHLRSRQPTLPIVLCSGHALENLQEDIDQEPLMHFCGKPFTLSGLKDCVEHVLQ